MKRSDLLEAVERVKISVDKSSSMTGMDFLLLDKTWLRGFNDTLSVSFPIKVNVSGAVKARELAEILGKMEGDTIRVTKEEDKILIKDNKTTLKMSQLEEDPTAQLRENLSSLNTDEIEWGDVPERFLEGLSICVSSAGTAPELGALAGVSFGGDMILSTDDLRVTQFTMGGQVSEPFVLPTNVAGSIIKFEEGFNGISVTDAWVHLRIENGTIISVRRLGAEYPVDRITGAFDEHFPQKGKKAKTYTLPENLVKSIERAEVLADKDEELMTMTHIYLKREGGDLLVRGGNEIGEVVDRVPWAEGKDFPEDVEMKISPSFLKKIIGMTRKFQLSPTKTAILFHGEFFKHLMIAMVK